MAAIAVTPASIAALNPAELRALQYGLAAYNRDSGKTALANVKEFLEMRINEDIVGGLVEIEASIGQAKMLAKFKNATDADRAAAIAALK